MFWRRRPRSDFADEIRSHLDLDADDLIRDGVPPDEAHTLARRRFTAMLNNSEAKTSSMFLDASRRQDRLREWCVRM